MYKKRRTCIRHYPQSPFSSLPTNWISTPWDVLYVASNWKLYVASFRFEWNCRRREFEFRNVMTNERFIFENQLKDICVRFLFVNCEQFSLNYSQRDTPFVQVSARLNRYAFAMLIFTSPSFIEDLTIFLVFQMSCACKYFLKMHACGVLWIKHHHSNIDLK